MAAVLPLDLPGLHAPQTSQVVWRGYWKKIKISHSLTHHIYYAHTEEIEINKTFKKLKTNN